jgi:hypothetical protein
MRSAAFQALCGHCAAHGLHVELASDHRSKNAKAPEHDPPRVNEICVTNEARQVLYRAPTTLANLDRAAKLALQQVA